MEVQDLISVSVFQLICVSLSKAGAKLLLYNIGSKLLKHFFGDFLHLLHKLLILNHAVMPGFCRGFYLEWRFLYLIINNKYYFSFRAKRRRVVEDSNRKKLNTPRERIRDHPFPAHPSDKRHRVDDN